MTYEQEKIKPYSQQGEKGAQVEAMFDNIAPTYDFLNHAMSLNIDKMWRKKTIAELNASKPQRILDIATGTGDFAILAARELKAESIIGADISEGMMEIGRKKVAQLGLAGTISFAKEDCMSLSFGDNTFDAVIAAFGIRNFPDLDKGLAEICRVLKPGGMMSVVELTTPVSFPMKQLFGLYTKIVLPVYGRIVSNDRAAYEYLNKSIAAFPQGERMQSTAQSRFKRHASSE